MLEIRIDETLGVYRQVNTHMFHMYWIIRQYWIIIPYEEKHASPVGSLSVGKQAIFAPASKTHEKSTAGLLNSSRNNAIAAGYSAPYLEDLWNIAGQITIFMVQLYICRSISITICHKMEFHV